MGYLAQLTELQVKEHSLHEVASVLGEPWHIVSLSPL